MSKTLAALGACLVAFGSCTVPPTDAEVERVKQVFPSHVTAVSCALTSASPYSAHGRCMVCYGGVCERVDL